LGDTEEIVGGVVSCTFTTELQLLLLPDASATLQENGVEPSGNTEPDGGTQAGCCTPGQLSETVGLKVTLAPLGEVHSPTGAGQEMLGGC